ncbi:ATP-dependent RNA helicase vasa [Vespa crabro]|uniref:ATP-dependent RNA helicase vasa n=1 Tax=Vespa crabro TaxID=7445 RepID=UPI001F022DD2|nr:ATP-dependent RNA helicase vasa [Vespa crabro]
MTQNWDNENDYPEPVDVSSFEDDGGRGYGRGRGFILQNNNNKYNDNFGYNDNKLADSDNIRNVRGGGVGISGGGRGRNGRGGGGGGGGGYGKGIRGGYRNENHGGGDNSYGYDDENDFNRSTKDDNCYENDNKDEGWHEDDDEKKERDFKDGKGRKESRGGGKNHKNVNNDGGDNEFDFNKDHGKDRGGRSNRGNRGSRGRGRGGSGGGSRGGNKEGDEDSKEKTKTEVYIPPDVSTDEKSLFENGVQQGINFKKYDQIEVCVSGDNVPQWIESFEDAGLRKYILSNIQKSKYTKPTPVQKYALPIIMSGRDMMACAQTGSGKTAAFVVPIVNTLLESPREHFSNSTCSPQVIIISPTRELTIQIYEQVLKFSAGTILKAVVAYGGTSVSHQGSRVSAGCDIIVATPGRLLDFLQRGRITLTSIRFLVLDEADRMLDMGFLPDVEKIVDHETMVPTGERQTLMFSATFPDEIQRLASRFLKDYLFVAVGIVGGACSDVEQKFYEVTKYKKREMLKELMEKETVSSTQQGTLVFVEMKRTADFIAAFLSENNYPTTSIHGDRLQREREEALKDFRSGRMSVLVATAVAARGLDIRNVAHVINYDLPKGIDEYVHRIGRTGRVGNRGRATSFFDPDIDTPLLPDLVKILKQADQPIPDWLLNGGDNKSLAPGKSKQFGGEDIRNFEDESSGVPYGEEAYNPVLEPEEEW